MKNPKYLNEAFETVCRELAETFAKKYKDYGKGNILSMKELGIVFREVEKAERLKNLLMKQNEPKNESIHDTWVDIAVYAVVALMFRNGWFQKLNMPDEAGKK